MKRYECTECEWTGETLFSALDHAKVHDIRLVKRKTGPSSEDK
jgi:hypothetical protein